MRTEKKESNVYECPAIEIIKLKLEEPILDKSGNGTGDNWDDDNPED